MSYGDDIMATGHAKIAQQEYPDSKVVFADSERMHENENGKKTFHWSTLFENNPNILQPDEDAENVIMVNDCPPFRPYINRKKSKYVLLENGKKAPIKIAYNLDFEAPKGEIYFSDDEIAKAKIAVQDIPAPYIIIEPSANVQINNRSWILERWLEVIKSSPLNFVQLGPATGTKVLDGCQHIVTDSFRDACAALKVSVGNGLFLGTEGDLHHAAAAVGLPAIVLWSHYSHPDILGYENHINIRWDAAGAPCGLRESCAHCKRSLEMIKVADVLLAIDMAIKEIR